MFTGIVEELGTVVGIIRQADAVSLRVQGAITSDARPGDSISVDGCCLTVVSVDDGIFTADVMRETLDKTSLAAVLPGSRVNLERAVTPQTRLGGHLVQGHVDATGRVESRAPSKHWESVWFSVPSDLARYLAVKGSVAVDGVSLTVVDLRDGDRPALSVGLIPTTLERTTLGFKRPGDLVNLEVDVMAKYAERILLGTVIGHGPTQSTPQSTSLGTSLGTPLGTAQSSTPSSTPSSIPGLAPTMPDSTQTKEWV